jgi:transposase
VRRVWRAHRYPPASLSHHFPRSPIDALIDRGQEAIDLKREPEKKARRWVVEVAHSWFNRFRKLLVRYEKLDRSLLALKHLAASIMAFRKIKLDVNIIYG